ncbi:MAG: NTP transferase domain-containing protein, partial [Burkholderiaceae bacterium]
SANRNLQRNSAIAEVVTDTGLDLEPFAGPMAGVLSGLRRSTSEWLVTVPCDAPRLPLDLVSRLFSAASNTKASAACVYAAARMQPMFALISRSATDSLAQSLASGERAMHHWLASLPAVQVQFEDARAFANINALADAEKD